MPIVTSIKPQKGKKKVNVYLDGNYSFSLDLETLIRTKLKVETNLEDDDVKKLVKETQFKQAYEKILSFGSLRPRSEKEFRDWLRKHKIHKSLHEEILKKLENIDFLNDRKFAIWWVDQRQSFRPKSVRELIQELRLKGIDKDIIDEVLNEADIDEETAIKKLLGKNMYKWKGLSEFETRKKKSEFLLRKGYRWDSIIKVLKNNSVDE